MPSAWSHYSSPVLTDLHWLPIRHRVKYKLARSDRVQVHDDTTTVLPPWTDSSLQTIEATASTRQEPAIGYDSRTNLNFTKRAFCHAIPTVWNNLSQSVIFDLSISLSTFKSRLKTELYSCALVQSESECKCLTCNQKPTRSQFSLLQWHCDDWCDSCDSLLCEVERLNMRYKP